MLKAWTSALSLAVILTTAAYGFGTPEHSNVAVTTKTSDKGLVFDFKINADDGHTVTFDAPWALEIKKHDGLEFAKTKLQKEDLDEKLPGFTVKTDKSPAAEGGEIEYRLTSFICTADKTQCYREVHKGKYSWKK